MTNHVHECTNGYQNKYAWDLTCHQNTNRMLFVIPRHPRLDDMAYICGYKDGFTNQDLDLVSMVLEVEVGVTGELMVELDN